MKVLLSIFVCISLSMLISCSAMKYEVPQAELLPTLKITGGKSQSLLLSKLMINIPRGEKIGKTSGGVFCINPRDIIWKTGIVSIGDQNFKEVFDSELKKNGYEAMGSSNSLFEEKTIAKPDFLVAGEITNISETFCYPNSGFGNFDYVRGGVFIKIRWEVYSTRTNSVELSISTLGSSGKEQQTHLGPNEFMLQAFRMAVQNLLAEEKFHNLVATEKIRS